MKKKVLSIFLCLCMVITLLPTSAMAWELTPITYTPIELLSRALNAAYTAGGNQGACCTVSGDTVTMTASVALTNTIEITSGTIILELAGQTITGKAGNDGGAGYSAISVGGTADVTIQDNGNGGKIVGGTGGNGGESVSTGGAGGNGLTVSNGTVTLRGGTFTGGNGGYGCFFGGTGGSGLTVSSGTVTLRGGTFTGGNGGYGTMVGGNGGNGLTVSDGGNIKLSGGIFTGGNGGESFETGGAGGKAISGSVRINAGYGAYDADNDRISSTALATATYISIHRKLATSVTVGGVVLNSETRYWKNGDTATATGNAEDYNAYFDAAAGTLTLKDAVVMGAEVVEGNNIGIFAENCLTVTPVGYNTVVGGVATGDEGGSSGLFCSGILTVNGSGSLTAVGGNAPISAGVYAGLTIEFTGDATVTAVGEASTGLSYGIAYGEGDPVIISGGRVTAVGGKAASLSIGVFGEVQYNGGLLVAKGGTSALHDAATGSIEGNILAGENNDSSKYVVFGDSTTYHVQVGNVDNDTNKHQTDNHIAWNRKALTLTDTVIIGEDGSDITAAALTIPSGGKLTLSGFNVVLAGDSSNLSNYAVFGNGELSIDGNGTLTAISGAATGDSYGMRSANATTLQESNIIAIGGAAESSGGMCGKLIFQSGMLTAIGGEGSSYSYGVRGSNITQDGGTLTAIGGAAGDYSYGVSAYDNDYSRITLNGGSGTAIGGSGTTVNAMNKVPITFGIATTGEYTDKVMMWVSVPTHMHCVCGGSDDCLLGDHTEHSTAITYTAIPADFVGGALTSGNYYLDRDVTLTESVTIAEGQTVNLCLNGHKLDAGFRTDGTYIGDIPGNFSVIVNSGTLNVCDCSSAHRYGQRDGFAYSITDTAPQGTYDTLPAGMITGASKERGAGGGIYNTGVLKLYSGAVAGNCAKAAYGGGVCASGGNVTLYNGSVTGNIGVCGGGIYISGSFIMFCGTIQNNFAPYHGGGLYIEDTATADISGGSITGNKVDGMGGGIYVNGNDGVGAVLNLSGAPNISGNKNYYDASNSDVCLDDSAIISITGTLSNVSPIGISMIYPGVFTGGTAVDNSSYQQNFVGDIANYTVVATENGQLKLSAIVSVDISWSSMEFTYDEGTWQPSSHSFTGNGWVCDTDENKISVVNNGTADVNITYVYTQTNTAFAGTFTDSSNTPITAAIPLAAEDRKDAWLKLSGTPAEYITGQTLGTITVVITG